MNKLFYAVIIFLLLLGICLYPELADNPDTSRQFSIASFVGKSDKGEMSAIGSKIIYMKYFNLSGSYSVSYSNLDNSLAGKSKKELAEYFPEWDILFMDSEKIILEQVIESFGPQSYIISTTEVDGEEYVCVYSFDDMGEKSIHSIFDTPIMLFDEQTVDMLRNGVVVTGKDALEDALEDFGE